MCALIVFSAGHLALLKAELALLSTVGPFFDLSGGIGAGRRTAQSRSGAAALTGHLKLHLLIEHTLNHTHILTRSSLLRGLGPPHKRTKDGRFPSPGRKGEVWEVQLSDCHASLRVHLRASDRSWMCVWCVAVEAGSGDESGQLGGLEANYKCPQVSGLGDPCTAHFSGVFRTTSPCCCVTQH